MHRKDGLPPTYRAPKYWRPDEIDTLKMLVDNGYGYEVIARRLGRSREAVEIKAKRLNCRLTRTPARLTARAVGRVLDIDAKAVTRWIERRGLKARRTRRTRYIWRVDWEDLCAWLEDRRNWICYDAARCTLATLRDHLQEIQAAAGGRWLTVGEVARRYCVSIHAVAQWIDKNWLPAERWGNRYIWSADIEGWVPPCERSKAGIPRGAGRIVVGPDRIVRKEAA